jgi:hypothetical protein
MADAALGDVNFKSLFFFISCTPMYADKGNKVSHSRAQATLPAY